MLALPNAVALTGLRAGVPLLFMYSLFSIFTIHLLNALYCEYKARKVSILQQGVPVLPLLCLWMWLWPWLFLWLLLLQHLHPPASIACFDLGCTRTHAYAHACGALSF